MGSYQDYNKQRVTLRSPSKYVQALNINQSKLLIELQCEIRIQ